MQFDSFIITRKSILASHLSDLSIHKSDFDIEMEDRKNKKDRLESA